MSGLHLIHRWKWADGADLASKQMGQSLLQMEFGQADTALMGWILDHQSQTV